MFTDEFLPQEQIDNIKLVYQELNHQFWEGLFSGRKKLFKSSDESKMEEFKNVLTQHPVPSEAAVKMSLIDSLGHSCSQFNVLQGLDAILTEASLKPMELFMYYTKRQKEINSERKTCQSNIGVVYLDGTIKRGEGSQTNGSVLTALFKAVLLCDAVVIRINSGGGEPIASEDIFEAVRLLQLKSGKPIYASFGNIAASGGYLSAAASTAIFASPGTITGSIGVAALRPRLTPEFLEKTGLSITPIYTHPGQANASIFEALDEKGRAYWKSRSASIYKAFLRSVATGRQMTMDEVDKVGRGQIWTGKQALEHGLVDELGMSCFWWLH
jgi:signal peptide peptidase SppA